MKHPLFIITSFVILLSGCGTTQTANRQEKAEGWFNVAVADDIEFYTDTTSIRYEESLAYAREKLIYITFESKKLYVDKIRNSYTQMGKAEKAEKWDDFSYCIYEREYDCVNQRFRTLSVEDFDSTGKRILKTITPKKNLIWQQVKKETIGDYTFFFVCDYQQ